MYSPQSNLIHSQFLSHLYIEHIMPPKKNRPIFKKINSKKKVANTRRRNLVKLIKDLILKRSETKYMSKNVTFTNRDVNTIYAVNLWGHATPSENVMPLVGNTDGTRIGDSIVTNGYKIRYNLELLGSYNQMHLKFFFIPFNSNQGDPTQRTQLTHDLTGFLSTDPIQTKRWGGIKYLGKRFIRPTDSVTSGNRIVSGSFWIPLKKTINFTTDTSNQPANMKEYGYLLYYMSGFNSAGGSDSTNVLINGQFCSTLYYKDP